jgi:acetone carboxylase gamma subunit
MVFKDASMVVDTVETNSMKTENLDIPIILSNFLSSYKKVRPNINSLVDENGNWYVIKRHICPDARILLTSKAENLAEPIPLFRMEKKLVATEV